MDRGAWRATVHSIAKSQTRLKQLSTASTHGKVLKWGTWKMEVWKPMNLPLIFSHFPTPCSDLSWPFFPDTHGLAVCSGVPKLEQCSGPPHLTWLLPGRALSLSSPWRHPRGSPPVRLLLFWGPSFPCASHHHNAHSLYYNGLLMHLYPTIPDWELCQTGDHVLFMAESAGLGQSPHTVNLLNKWTNNWIHALLTSVASNRENKKTNNTHWLHWFFLKWLHHRCKVGPRLLQLFRTMFTLPCSHAFICAFSEGKFSSWAGHLVTGPPAEQSRWHPALHPLFPVGEGPLCLIGDLQSSSQSNVFQMQTANCDFERYSLWHSI